MNGRLQAKPSLSSNHGHPSRKCCNTPTSSAITAFAMINIMKFPRRNANKRLIGNDIMQFTSLEHFILPRPDINSWHWWAQNNEGKIRYRLALTHINSRSNGYVALTFRGLCYQHNLAKPTFSLWRRYRITSASIWFVITSPCASFNGNLTKLPTRSGHVWWITYILHKPWGV